MFGKMYLLPYLVVPLISARVPLISTKVSAHCQAILLGTSSTTCSLTHIGLVMPYCEECGHHWFR